MWKAGYRHYNLLVDICFWVLAVRTLFWGVNGFAHLSDLPLVQSAGLVIVLNVLVGIATVALFILILARPLRDEYSQRLWQETAGAFMVLLALLPFIWMAVFWLFYSRNGMMDWYRANPGAAALPARYLFPNANGSIAVHQIEGINFSLLRILSQFPFAFAAIYKWKRWRGERA